MTDVSIRTLKPLHPTDLSACLTAMVISDTHGRLPDSVIPVLRIADVIIHAGDLDTEDILNRLLGMAPVVAVRGNMDRGPWASCLSRMEIFQIGRHRICLLHDLSALDMDPLAAGIDVIIHGHTHQPMNEKRNHVLFINPGSASHPRNRSGASVMKLSFNESTVHAERILV